MHASFQIKPRPCNWVEHVASQTVKKCIFNQKFYHRFHKSLPPSPTVGQSNIVHTRTLIFTLSSRLRQGFHSGFTLQVLWQFCMHFLAYPCTFMMGRDRVVGMATRCGLGGPEIESPWGEIFRTRPDRPWGRPSILDNGYGIFPGSKAAGAWSWPSTSPPTQRAVKKEFSYIPTSPLGLHGLFYGEL